MKKPDYIDDAVRESMKRKEQDLILMLCERKYTKKQIMRKLYITSEVGYWKLRMRVNKKIKRQ